MRLENSEKFCGIELSVIRTINIGADMIIIPAIDIIGGKVVRLSEGDYDKVKNYGVSPIDVAADFKAQGAEYLHVVDLDGARSGEAVNAKLIEQIVLKCNMMVEVGGGIRDFDKINRYLDCGASKVILGTVAVRDFQFVERAVKAYGDKIAVGVDAKDNFVAVDGWRKITEMNSLEFCKKLKYAGVDNVIYTDISKDGMMSGTNLELYKVLCQTEYPKITASGGITTLNELIKLNELGAYGAILGKSLYEGAIDLKSALEALGGKN